MLLLTWPEQSEWVAGSKTRLIGCDDTENGFLEKLVLGTSLTWKLALSIALVRIPKLDDLLTSNIAKCCVL